MGVDIGDSQNHPCKIPIFFHLSIAAIERLDEVLW